MKAYFFNFKTLIKNPLEDGELLLSATESLLKEGVIEKVGMILREGSDFNLIVENNAYEKYVRKVLEREFSVEDRQKINVIFVPVIYNKKMLIQKSIYANKNATEFYVFDNNFEDCQKILNLECYLKLIGKELHVYEVNTVNPYFIAQIREVFIDPQVKLYRAICVHLYDAVSTGNLEKLENLVKQFSLTSFNSLSLEENEDINLLVTALRHNHIRIAEFLVGKGVNIDNIFIQDCINVSDPNEKVLQFLIRNGIDIDQIDERDADNTQTLLHRASRDGNIKLAEVLLNNGADIDKRDGYEGCAPLHFAVEGGSFEVVSYLVGRGANVDIVDDDDKTPSDLVRCVIQQKCDLRPETASESEIEMNSQIIFQNLELRKYLQRWSRFNKLVEASKSPNKEKIKHQYKISCNQVISEWRSKKESYLKVDSELEQSFIQLLGGENNARNRRPIPLLMPSKMNKSPTAKIQSISSFLWHQAVKNGDIIRIKSFLDDGMNIDEPDEQGCTALHLAIEGGNFELVKYLVDRGANLDVENFQGKTPCDLVSATVYSASLEEASESDLQIIAQDLELIKYLKKWSRLNKLIAESENPDKERIKQQYQVNYNQLSAQWEAEKQLHFNRDSELELFVELLKKDNEKKNPTSSVLVQPNPVVTTTMVSFSGTGYPPVLSQNFDSVPTFSIVPQQPYAGEFMENAEGYYYSPVLSQQSFDSVPTFSTVPQQSYVSNDNPRDVTNNSNIDLSSNSLTGTKFNNSRF